MVKPKVTLLICTHNGEMTLNQALEAIANQTDASRDIFEVLVVDNASTDQTINIATQAIEKLNLPGRVISEPKIGKINAFLKGIHEAKGEFISIVDDDNFIEPDFLRYTLEILENFRDVGMVGSKNSIFTTQPTPEWFSWVRGRYACAQPMLSDIEIQLPNGIVIAKSGVIAGAGSTFRVKPVIECIEKGYSFFNDTQRGKNMRVAGEDLELCYLIHSLGRYRFAFDPRIQIRHSIKAERLNLDYLSVLTETQGAGALGADPFMFTHKFNGKSWPFKWTWKWQLISKLRRYIKLSFLCIFPVNQDAEERFRNRNFRIECMGSIKRILVDRDKYDHHIRQVAAGEWTVLRIR
ncbi:MAG: glycosyltransferase family 2 protein [Leptolyngbyaceae cyanobacterium SL_5_14]|nr:glycosyltransferase family 2 protein [Leptolyngbyaceae cyanobacterium SL_5_14]